MDMEVTDIHAMDEESGDDIIAAITTLHTLGPRNTNCENAARHWLAIRGRAENVVLYGTLEEAIEKMPCTPHDALLGCVVYPDLHTIVFRNLERLQLVDCFVVPTYNMVLAARDPGLLFGSVATHPAPQSLVPEGWRKELTTSNAQAALECQAGRVHACITTLAAARDCGLSVLRDFGPVNMGFSIHAQPLVLHA